MKYLTVINKKNVPDEDREVFEKVGKVYDVPKDKFIPDAVGEHCDDGNYCLVSGGGDGGLTHTIWFAYKQMLETGKEWPVLGINYSTGGDIIGGAVGIDFDKKKYNQESLKSLETGEFEKQYFDLIIGDALKPKFDNFKKFQEFVGAEMNELIMVGDDIKADIEPAIKLGMKTIHIHRGYEYLKHHAQLNIKPYKKIHDLSDIFQAIQEIQG